MEHSGGVELAYVLIRVGARVHLSDDDVLDVERRWKTGRMRGRSTVSSHTNAHHISDTIAERGHEGGTYRTIIHSVVPMGVASIFAA